MARTSLRLLPSQFEGSTISEIAKTDEGILIQKTNGDIVMLPVVYEYSEEDRNLISCLVAALFDLGVISAEHIKGLQDSQNLSKETKILQNVYRLPDLVEERQPWWGYGMYFCDPIFTKAKETVLPLLSKVIIRYYDSIDDDYSAENLYEEVCKNMGLHIISIYGEDLSPCSVLCVDKLVKPDHVILYCWNPNEPTTGGLVYNCVLSVKKDDTTIITYKSQYGGYQYDDIRLDTSTLLVRR